MDIKKGTFFIPGMARSKKGKISHTLLIPSDLTRIDYFKDIVDTLRDPLLVLDKDLRVLSANLSFYKLFKVKTEETVGALVYNLGDGQWDIPALRTLLETILPQKAAFNDYQVEHDFPTIGRRSLLLNARRIPAPPKESTWILLAFEDNSEHMHLEQALLASEQRFRRVFETATDVMLLVDKISGVVLNSNRAAQQTFSYSKQKLLKMNLWELGILKDYQEFDRVSHELEEKGALQILNNSIQTRGGRQFPASIYLTDRTDVMQCNVRDITSSKQAEEALRVSEEHHRLLLASIQSPVLALRTDMTILYCNAAYAEVLGKPLENLLDENIQTLLPDLWKSPAYVAYKRCFETGNIQVVETNIRGKYFQEKVFPTPWGLLAIADDVSEKMKALEAGRKLMQAREEFIASISHDIRTPLFSISGYLDLLRKGKVKDPAVAVEFLTRAWEDTDRLKGMMNEILDIYRLQDGHLSLNYEKVDLCDVIRTVLDLMQARADARGIAMKFASATPALIAEADSERMQRVLVNLLENAIKFSEIGRSISITAEAIEGTITIKIRDHGSGIPTKDLPNIFDRFTQVKSKIKNTLGRGLGLYTCNSIIKAHGGSITVTSLLGKGSTFTITMPVKPGDEK